MAIKKVTEIPTIDVNLVTVKPEGLDTEYIFDTANSIEVAPETEEEDAVKLVIKGVLKAQKPSVMTITGNTITLTDNVFAPELVKILHILIHTQAGRGKALAHHKLFYQRHMPIIDMRIRDDMHQLPRL